MWKYIEEINWAKLSQKRRGYDEGKRHILLNFTQKRANEIREFVSERFSELYTRIEKFEQANDCRCGNYGGDDSFNDMISHVIGMGEKFFAECMEDPRKLNTVEYVESFSYCFPYEDDFKMLDEQYHVNRAVKAIGELARIVSENEPSSEDIMVIKELMNRFLSMVAGDMKSALENYDFDKDYNRFYKFKSNDCSAMFANYISDAAETTEF